MKILEKAQKMLRKHPLCSNCLGRQFALLGRGLSNQVRGKMTKTLLVMYGHQLVLSGEESGITLLRTVATNGSSDVASEVLRSIGQDAGERKECCLCEEQFASLDGLVERCTKELHPYEFGTFLVGIRLPAEIAEREDEFKAEFGIEHGESMRNEFSREIGKAISEITGKTAEYEKPDVVVITNPFTKRVTLQVNPLFIAGRYRKLMRGIPQSKWICAQCKGNGCERCRWTGKLYAQSVEEIIAEPALEMTDGEDASFHAAGREDIDARMLGKGRPFVIEIKKPKKRFINLAALTKCIAERAKGRVEVLELTFSNKNAVRMLKKMERAEKIYRVLIEFDRDVSTEELETLDEKLTNVVIRQQTPKRVLRRRADLVRERYIYKAETERLTPNSVKVVIRCQGGLYIKELVNGDEGRTDPCISEIVGAEASPLELDVLDVISREHF